MYLYTFEGADGDAVYDSYTTTDLVAARDHAARYHLRLIENTFEFSDSELIEDYTSTQEDPS